MSQKIISVGQDSFLDIVANLVGVLIILIVVVGAQAKSNFEESAAKNATESLANLANETANVESTVQATESESKAIEDSIAAYAEFQQQSDAIEKLQKETRLADDEVSKLERDNFDLENKIHQHEQISANMTDRRHAMLLQMEMVRRDIESRQAKLDEDQQVAANLARQKSEWAFELTELENEITAMQVNFEKTEPGTIDHFPNPIAETVFSQEVHFRLSGGRLSYVPMDELIGLMKTEWKFKAEKLQRSSVTRETVGPIGNFRMQYELEARSVPASQTSAAQRMVRFKHFTLHPVNPVAGESIDQALGLSAAIDRSGRATNRSQWLTILSGKPAASTTVSIWVYPDSYEEHGRLKKWLHENGFKMASWPLEMGRMISGGPDGFRTSAQ